MDSQSLKTDKIGSDGATDNLLKIKKREKLCMSCRMMPATHKAKTVHGHTKWLCTACKNRAGTSWINGGRKDAAGNPIAPAITPSKSIFTPLSLVKQGPTTPIKVLKPVKAKKTEAITKTETGAKKTAATKLAIAKTTAAKAVKAVAAKKAVATKKSAPATKLAKASATKTTVKKAKTTAKK